MTFKKAIGNIHLWLGLATGLVFFVVCFTAAIWAFSPEIEPIIQPYRNVTNPTRKPYLPIGRLKQIADKQLPNRTAERIDFEGKDKAAIVNLSGSGDFKVFIDPYTGTVQQVMNLRNTFFHFIIKGHYSLWLGSIGEDIVHYATILFLVLLITGIILWFPKNKAARKQRFTIKWSGSFKRVNYDLHAVLGFYASWIILFSVVTALVWGFDVVSKAEQWIADGGVTITSEAKEPQSIPCQRTTNWNGIDSVWANTLSKYPHVQSSVIAFPEGDSDVFTITVYTQHNTYHYDDYYFDQYSLKQLPTNEGNYSQLSNGTKLNRMNYDIHIGSIAGFAGRTALFFASLICSSLPITGFLIWLKRKKKPILKGKASPKK